MKAELVVIIEEIADLLEFKGENQFKIRAFRNAAQSLRDADVDIAEAVRTGTLDAIPGVGKGIAAVIREFVETGAVRAHEELTEEIPAGLVEMTRLPGFGPKKALAVYEQLGIASIGELEYACKENRLKDLKGFGEKTQEKILDGIRRWNANRNFARQHRAMADAERLLAALRALPGVHTAELTGDLRRWAEVVDCLHFVVVADSLQKTTDALGEILQEVSVEEAVAKALSPNGIRVIIEQVESERLPWHVYRTTGSQMFTEQIDVLLERRGLQPTGTALLHNGLPVFPGNEAEIFRLANIHFIEPEAREGMGEIETAQDNSLPVLVEEKDMRGMLHIHTTWSDGHASVREMALEAKALGYEYIAICDHSKSAFYVNGLTEDRVKAQHEEIDRLNTEGLGIHIFKGIESDILADGSLDYSDTVLETFDLIVASVHSLFTMPRQTMTERIVNAVRNPFTTILGHPTGRLLLAREGYAVDIDAVLEAAAESGTVVEINANPYRLDLAWPHVRRARAMGIRLAVNPDAHHPDELRYVRYGIGVARKGLLPAESVVNTLSRAQFETEVLGRMGGRRSKAGGRQKV